MCISVYICMYVNVMAFNVGSYVYVCVYIGKFYVLHNYITESTPFGVFVTSSGKPRLMEGQKEQALIKRHAERVRA